MPHMPTQGQVADAVKGNWVDTAAPAAWRPYLRLSRADRPIGTWLLLLPCWWGLALACLGSGEAGWRDAWIALGCAIGAFVMRGAGCTWNDIADRHIDGRVARTRSRPIPSGQASVRGALVWIVVQSLAGLAVLLTFGWAAIWLGVASLALVAVYPFAKRFTWWPQAFLGLAFNWGALLAWAAHMRSVEWWGPPVLLYGAGIAWTLFYDTIYAHQDTEDDALIGVKSTARLFGDHSRTWLWRFAILSPALLALAVVAAQPSGLGLAVALAAPAALLAHLSWQMGRLDVTDPAACTAVFRSNRDAGLLVALILAVAAAL